VEEITYKSPAGKKRTTIRVGRFGQRLGIKNFEGLENVNSSTELGENSVAGLPFLGRGHEAFRERCRVAHKNSRVQDSAPPLLVVDRGTDGQRRMS